MGTAAVQLEVAMGLETAHPDALERLNKRMTVEDFTLAAERLLTRGVSLRVFLLISPPFVPLDEQNDWLLRSIAVPFSCGAATEGCHSLSVEPKPIRVQPRLSEGFGHSFAGIRELHFR